MSGEYIEHSSVNIVVNRVSTVDHQSIHKFCGLDLLSSELSRHHNLEAGPTGRKEIALRLRRIKELDTLDLPWGIVLLTLDI